MPELDDHDQQQVDLLICGGVVLPMTGADDLIWKGAVAVDGGKIVAVGADEELRRQFQPRRTIDASDQLVKRRVAVIFGRWRSLGVLAAALVLGGANALQLRVGEQPYIEAAFWGALALVAFALLGGELLPNRGRLRISAVTLTGLAGIASVVLLITQPHISLSQPLWVGFPYVVALLVLAGARTSARMPSALAVAYRRGQR